MPFPECKIVQHAVRLKAENAGSLPLIANYKLGPVIGSVCDSIYRLKEEWEIDVTPTIVDQSIKIQSSRIFEFSIPLNQHFYDVSGRELLTKSFNSESLSKSIDLTSLPSGLYFYTIVS